MITVNHGPGVTITVVKAFNSTWQVTTSQNFPNNYLELLTPLRSRPDRATDVVYRYG
jgi:hypothetical protein